MARTDWNTYFMKIAVAVAERATCDRASVGCVIVKDKRILSTGYNGAVAGAQHCNEVGHLMIDGHCGRVIHAESNAIISAAKHGVAIDGATAYCTLEPCLNCTKAFINAGIRQVYFNKYYKPNELVGWDRWIVAPKRFSSDSNIWNLLNSIDNIDIPGFWNQHDI